MSKEGHESVPDMPGIQPHEFHNSVFLLVDEMLMLSIGWQQRSARKGGSCFVIARRTAMMGSFAVSRRFPLTVEGWVQAWQALVELDDSSADLAREALAQRASLTRELTELRQLEEASLNYLPVTFLGGYAQGTDLIAGTPYDVRFLEDLIAVLPRRSAKALVEVSYDQVQVVDIGGPGVVKTGGGFAGGGFDATGAAEGIAIAAVLNAITTRTKIKTVIRIQAATCELFFLHTTIEPDALRIQLSRSLGAIRQAQSAQRETSENRDAQGSTSLVDQLTKLASLLEKGLLTQQEFESLKAKLIADS